MIHKKQWDQVRALIEKGRKFVFTTHVNPDGDAIGSEVALACYLKQLGKQIAIFNSSPTPRMYQFLDPQGEIRIFNPQKHSQKLKETDAIFILDISDWKRLREIGTAIRKLTVPKVGIDHHRITDQVADIQIVDEHASSTGELIYDFLSHCDGEITEPVGEALYTAILTDTGGFRFSNTTPRVHRISAELLSSGVNFQRIYEEVYERSSKARMRLLGHVLNGLNYTCGGRVAWFAITQKMLQEIGAALWEAEGFPEVPRNVEGVELSIMFVETNDGKVKVSLRSKGQVEVNTLAVKYGGGGHQFAAGMLLAKPLRDSVQLVLAEIARLFEC